MKIKLIVLILVLGAGLTACKKSKPLEQSEYYDGQLQDFSKYLIGKFELNNYSSEPSQTLLKDNWPYRYIQLNETTSGGYGVTLYDKYNVVIGTGKAELKLRTIKEQQTEGVRSIILAIHLNGKVTNYILTTPTGYQLQLVGKVDQNGLIYNYFYFLTKI